MNAASLQSWRRMLRATSLAMALAATAGAKAGTPCDASPPTAQGIERAMTLADHVQRSLDTSGAQVVLIARAGQDLRKYGLTYSHLAFAYREAVPVETPPRVVDTTRVLASMGDADAMAAEAAQLPASPTTRAVWRVAHKLNQCGTAKAAVFRQGLGQFFMDTPFEYRAAYVVPDPEVQAALLQTLRDDKRLLQWHTPAYSVVAYPWATTYQQSNQWALETLAGSLDPAASTRTRAQAWLRLHDYRPTVLHIDAFTRLGARITKANVAFDDHPNGQRFTDHIATVTVDSMFNWLQRENLAGAPVTVW
jgi:hypothetical protein